MLYRVSAVKSSLESSPFWASSCYGLSYYGCVWSHKR